MQILYYDHSLALNKVIPLLRMDHLGHRNRLDNNLEQRVVFQNHLLVYKYHLERVCHCYMNYLRNNLAQQVAFHMDLFQCIYHPLAGSDKSLLRSIQELLVVDQENRLVNMDLEPL